MNMEIVISFSLDIYLEVSGMDHVIDPAYCILDSCSKTELFVSSFFVRFN